MALVPAYRGGKIFCRAVSHNDRSRRGCLLMSHYTRVRTRLTDASLLALALTDLGFMRPEVHDIAQPLIGYEGDVRRTKAEVIVRRDEVGVASNDIGFAKKPDGTFEAIISAFDRSHYGKAWLERLSHAYSLRAVDSFAECGG